MSQSEVTRLREQIRLEYEASQRVFTDFTPTARHQFLTKRQENIASCFEELKQYVSAQEAAAILTQIANIS
jgi:F0F1-type ATP synthase gamma subunit